MPNRTEARSAKAALTNATGRLPLLRLFSTLLKMPGTEVLGVKAVNLMSSFVRTHNNSLSFAGRSQGLPRTAFKPTFGGKPDATRETPAVIIIRINWQLVRDRPGRVGWRRGS